jgi:toxin ParE1/3/4
MPTRNKSLTDRLDRFVETSVSTCRYQDASEVVREGLRLLEHRHQEDMLKLRPLRKAIQEGEGALAHDEYRDLDVDELPEFAANLGVTGAEQSGAQAMAGLRLTGPAERDIAGLLDWSAVTFGPAVRRRYEALVAAALSDLAHDWQRTGSVILGDVGPGWRIYHMRHSSTASKNRDRDRRAPRHIVVYRFTPNDVVIVLRVLHDSMDVTRHLDAPPQ